jgi:hypothetical protein
MLKMYVSSEECHVARFDAKMCYRAIVLLNCWQELKQILMDAEPSSIDLPLDLRFLTMEYYTIK